MKLDIRDEVFEIFINKITIAGQTDFIALLERICTCLKKNNGSKNKGIVKNDELIDGVESLSCDKYEDIGTLSDYLKTLKQGIYKEQISEEQESKEDRNKEQKVYPRLTLSVLCKPLVGSLKIRKMVGYALQNSYSEDGAKDGMMVYEEITKDDVNMLASSHEEMLSNEMLEEIEQFEDEIRKQIVKTRKYLQDQMMINAGYQFLIRTVKVKITRTETEIKKKRRVERKMLQLLENDSRIDIKKDKEQKEIIACNNYSRNVDNDNDGDKNNNGGGGDDFHCTKESEEGQEIERIKESILLADCLLEMQSNELASSKILMQGMSLKIEEKKKRVIDLVRRQNEQSTPSPNEIISNNWFRHDKKTCNDVEERLTLESLPLELPLVEATKESTLSKMPNGDCVECHTQDDSNIVKVSLLNEGGHVVRLFEKGIPSWGEGGSVVVQEEGLTTGRGGFFEKKVPGNDVINGDEDDALLTASSLLSSHNRLPPRKCYNFILDDHIPGYKDKDDNLCEVWLERLSILSTLIKFPSEALGEEETKQVTCYVHDAPRALGRSKRGRVKRWFKQAFYKTKAIAV